MDYIFEIMQLADDKIAPAMQKLNELQAEFHSAPYDQARIDRLELELDQMINQ